MPYEIDNVKLLFNPLTSTLDELLPFLVTTQVEISLPENSWFSFWQRLTLGLITLHLMFEKTLNQILLKSISEKRSEYEEHGLTNEL